MLLESRPITDNDKAEFRGLDKSLLSLAAPNIKDTYFAGMQNMIEDIKIEAIQTVQSFLLERFEPSVFL